MRNKVICIVCLLIPFISFGQEGEVEDKTVIIEKEAKLELPIANRNFEKINFEAPKTPLKPQTYELEDVELRIPNLTTRIRVLTMPTPPLKKLYGNYIKGGFGNYATPYLEAYLNNKRSEKGIYGLHIKHLSSKNGPVGKKLSGTSENLIRLHGKYFAGSVILKSNISYSRNRYNYYGFNENILPAMEVYSTKDLRQVYNTFAISAGLENMDKTNPIGYDVNFTYYNFKNSIKAKESEYLTDAAISYKINDAMGVSLGTALSISKRTDSSTISRTYFVARPAFLYSIGKYRLRAGFNAAYSNDTLQDYSKFHLYPAINIDATIMENKLSAFAGLEGDMQKNTLRSFVSENPYLKSDVVLYNTNKTLEFYAGIKGNVVSQLNYKIKFSYANYKLLYFYNNDTSYISRFNILYDKGTTTVFNFNPDLSYDLTERFRVGLNMNYFNYNVSTEERAWHRPGFTTVASGTYNFREKIYFNLDIYYLGGLRAKSLNKIVNLPSIFDVNVRVDYRFSSAFSAFIELNNLLSKKYERYLYYPVKGINVLAGLTYSF